MITFSAPGSLLLAGEYTVTAPGGLGLALAIGKRAELMAQPSTHWIFEGRWGQSGSSWKPGESPNGPASRLWLRLPEAKLKPAWKLTVDTGAFYTAEGRKKGYGSSAAAATLFASALLHILKSGNKVLDIAVAAHRDFQGGLGSGYDVAASLFGGAGLFVGGTVPRWHKRTWPEKLEARLLRGSSAIDTKTALNRYGAWLSEQGPTAHREKSDALIKTMPQNFMNDDDVMNFLEGLRELCALGRDLGRCIGVPAQPRVPSELAELAGGCERGLIKCLGAGNELSLLLTLPDALSRPERRVLKELELKGEAEILDFDPKGCEADK